MVEELVPGKKVVWHVVDALIDLPDLANKTEWVNTYIVWDIFSTANGTVLELTHVGLNLDMECYFGITFFDIQTDFIKFAVYALGFPAFA